MHPSVRPFSFALLSMIYVSGSLASSPPPTLTTTEIKTAIRDIEKDREETRQWLKSEPTSYLAAIRRLDFGSKTTLTVGSAEGNNLRIQDDSVRPRHLTITVQNDRFHVVALDQDAHFTVGKDTTPVREKIIGPGKIEIGRFPLRLSHQGYPAVIVFDPKSSRFKEYKGIRYFPIDLSYRYVVRLIPDSKTETISIKSSHSADRRALRIGWFEFIVGNKPCRLAANRLLEPGVDTDALSVFFRDATTGKESYSVGRYIEPRRQADGTYILDFNMAYNPACAFSKYYNCPIPPKENFLPVAIRAGEMDSHYH